MRSSACDTLSRSCARRVLCWPAFPSAPALRSTGSAADRPALFVGFIATMAGSDFSRPCIAGSAPRLPDADQAALRRWSDARSPGSRARSVRTCQGLRPRRAGRPLALARPDRVAFRDLKRVGTRDNDLFRGSMAGLCAPLPTLRPPLAERNARLGADVVRYSFIVADFHHPAPCRSPGALRLSLSFYT